MTITANNCITLSFCVTFFNQEGFVERCLSSIIKQKSRYNFEILVGDDGSKDKTISKIKEFQHKYPSIVKLYSSEKLNVGITNSIMRASNNRLNLLSKAKGDFILFVDGDDYYYDFDFINEALEKFKKNINLSVCAFDYRIEGSTQKHQKNNFKTKEEYIKSGYTHSAACIFRNNLSTASIDTFKRYKCFDDNLITLAFLAQGDFIYIDKIIYSYTQNPNSIWNSIATTEQTILNALDFNLSCELCPSLKKLLVFRYYHNISYLWKNRRTIIGALPKNNLDNLTKRALFYNDLLMYNILNWETLSINNKISTFFLFLSLRIKKKLG